MARPYFAAKHVESMSLLPENLTIGRAYFVDDEQVIVIDHGRGPVVYGKSPGPQGIAGEPIPQLQDQINALAEAELTTQRTIWEINEREVENAAQTDTAISLLRQNLTQEINDNYRDLDEKIAAESVRRESDIASLTAKHDMETQALTETVAANLEHSDSQTESKFEYVKELTAHNAEAITSLIATIHEQFQKYDSALNILAKSISELYPEHYAPEDSQDDPLDNETVYTDAGAYTIQQTTLKDGTVILNLTPQDQVVDTLKAGDTVDFDGSTWTVEQITSTDGTTTITIKP